MHTLNLYKTETIDTLAWPVVENTITVRSPAMSVFTDFKKHLPHVLDGRTPATKVEAIMRQSHVRMMLVVDNKNRFMGIVTSHDVGEQQLIKRMNELNLLRDELTVNDFLRPKTSLMSFDFTELARSTVGDVIETLKDYGQQHCLVMDRESHEVRGVISVSDIARELKLPLDIQGRPTFAELITILAA
jgi:CBS domain-containing protein